VEAGIRGVEGPPAATEGDALLTARLEYIAHAQQLCSARRLAAPPFNAGLCSSQNRLCADERTGASEQAPAGQRRQVTGRGALQAAAPHLAIAPSMQSFKVAALRRVQCLLLIPKDNCLHSTGTYLCTHICKMLVQRRRAREQPDQASGGLCGLAAF
jgi:hypothetical protein